MKSGVTVDFNGAIIRGSGFEGYGVTAHDVSDITIINATLASFYYGIRMENVSRVEFFAVNASSNWMDPQASLPLPPWLVMGRLESLISAGHQCEA